MNKNVIVLDVPFSEKEEAKMLGARWNPDIKRWFVPGHLNIKLFTKWISNDDQQQSKELDRD
jgi:hypothetical protein